MPFILREIIQKLLLISSSIFIYVKISMQELCTFTGIELSLTIAGQLHVEPFHQSSSSPVLQGLFTALKLLQGRGKDPTVQLLQCWKTYTNPHMRWDATQNFYFMDR